jgi:hypothetical protein
MLLDEGMAAHRHSSHRVFSDNLHNASEYCTARTVLRYHRNSCRISRSAQTVYGSGVNAPVSVSPRRHLALHRSLGLHHGTPCRSSPTISHRVPAVAPFSSPQARSNSCIAIAGRIPPKPPANPAEPASRHTHVCGNTSQPASCTRQCRSISLACGKDSLNHEWAPSQSPCAVAKQRGTAAADGDGIGTRRDS